MQSHNHTLTNQIFRYKSALRALYAKHGTVPVFFEVGRLSTKGGHAHVQAVPIPLQLKDKVELAFTDEGRSHGIDFEENPDAALQLCSGGRQSYFRVDLPDGRKMVHLMKDTVPFSIQFGRWPSWINFFTEPRLCTMLQTGARVLTQHVRPT